MALTDLKNGGILNMTYINKELKLLNGLKIMLLETFLCMEKNGIYLLDFPQN